jgi:chromate transport protein ChrA
MPNSDQPWNEILTAFLKLGATSYGGPAMMGIMQAELQGKRKWSRRSALSKDWR